MKNINYILTGTLLCVQLNAGAQNPNADWKSTWDETCKALNSSIALLNKEINEGLKYINNDLARELGSDEKEYHSYNYEYHTEPSEKNTACETYIESPGAYSEKKKIIYKNYTVDERDRLHIDNQFGDVIIKTWDKKEMRIEITIISNRSTEEKAQRDIENVEIQESRSSEQINLKTNFRCAIKNEVVKGSERSGIEINYLVYMPEVNPLDIYNKFGDILIPNFKGPVNVQSRYGSLTAGQLMNTQNDLDIRFGGAVIDAVRNADVTGAYGSTRIRSIGTAHIEHSFGKLDITEANILDGNINYSDATIGKLNESADLNVKFSGDFEINSFGAGFKNLDIDASYTNVMIDLPEPQNFDFDVDIEYGQFNVPAKVSEFNLKNDSQNHKVYSGQVGKGGMQMTLKNRFGNIKFK